LPLGSDLLVIAEPVFVTREKQQNAVLIKVLADGREIDRKEISATFARAIATRTITLIAQNRLLFIATEQQPGGVDTKVPNLFGLARWCTGAVTTQIRSFKLPELTFEQSFDMLDFETASANLDGTNVLLTGRLRERCADRGQAALVRFDEAKRFSTFWRDHDIFPSNAQSLIASSTSTKTLLVRRQRPTGVRSADPDALPADSKRWGDKGSELFQYSLVSVDRDYREVGAYNSSFGISAFPKGMARLNNQTVLYGSLGGRPAISPPLR
jgi:hypothetical protein